MAFSSLVMGSTRHAIHRLRPDPAMHFNSIMPLPAIYANLPRRHDRVLRPEKSSMPAQDLRMLVAEYGQGAIHAALDAGRGILH
jgi:hypothetical protein